MMQRKTVRPAIGGPNRNMKIAAILIFSALAFGKDSRSEDNEDDLPLPVFRDGCIVPVQGSVVGNDGEIITAWFIEEGAVRKIHGGPDSSSIKCDHGEAIIIPPTVASDRPAD